MKVTIKRTTGHGADLVVNGVESVTFDDFGFVILYFPGGRQQTVYHVKWAVAEKEAGE